MAAEGSIAVRIARRAGHAVEGPAAWWWRREVVRRGQDVTRHTADGSAMVLAPHPDDETIGCGATIARKRSSGTDVHVVAVADGHSSHPHSSVIGPDELVSLRAAEFREACRRLGVEDDAVVLLGHPDDTLDGIRDELAIELERLIDEVDPDVVYLPSPLDWHPDHRGLNAAARAALRRGRPRRVLEYPVWVWAEGPWAAGEPIGRLAGVLDPRASWPFHAELVDTGEFLDRKADALAAYRTQRENLTGEASWATLPDSWFGPFLGRYEVVFPAADLDRPGGWRPAAAPGTGAASPAPSVAEVHDRFTDDRPPGSVIGTVGPSGALRRGVDAERRLSVDHGALRIEPLVTPGWARSGVAYGPFERRAGLALAAVVLDGHNTSRTDFRPEGRRAKLRRLARGLLQGRLDLERPEVLDNLAVGFFGDEAPSDPFADHAIVMHAATVLNGELRVAVGGEAQRVERGIQNLPIVYVVVLRDEGAAYYATTLEGAWGIGGFPKLRPIGLDPRPLRGAAFAGIHQSVLGEVGYRVASRVYAVEVDGDSGLDEWCTTATIADRLVGDGPVEGTSPERGAPWEVVRGRPARTSRGLVAGDGGATLALPCPDGVGLVHLRIGTGPTPGGIAVELADSKRRGWRLELEPAGARLVDGGDVIATDAEPGLRAEAEQHLQILIGDGRVGVHLDGRMRFDGWVAVADDPCPGASTARLLLELAPGTTRVADLEAHPDQVTIPLVDRLALPTLPPPAGRVVVADDFSGPAGELEGRSPASGGGPWRRRYGLGRFLVADSGGLLVDADRTRPCPGRTLYTVPWGDERVAEIEIEAVPPGSRRGEGENGRGGLVFWQDPDNLLIVNPWVDDYEGHDGSSISSFLRTDGHEDMYDAVWTNVGRAVRWGEPYRLRVAFDGIRYLAWLNDEPVLYRAVTDIHPAAGRIRISEVGLATNWEWGDDTGTCFRTFRVRG